jgi:hypothetical protein
MRKLNDVKIKEKHQVEISNRLANLESLDKTVFINMFAELLEKI